MATVSTAVTSEQRRQVAALLATEMPSYERERLDWLGPSPDKPSISLIAADKVGEPVGTVSLIRRGLTLEGQAIGGGQAVDFAVARRARFAGTAIGLQRDLLATAGQNGVEVLYAFPNRASEPVLLHVGYRRLGHVRRWFRPLSVAQSVRRRGQRTPDWLLGPLAWCGDRLLDATAWQWNRGARLTAVDDLRFDARFDDLWERCRRQYVVIAERDARYLAWRFGRANARFLVSGVQDDRMALRAYAVWSPHGETAVVADFLADSAPSLRVLLCQLANRLQRRAFTGFSLLFSGPSEVRRQLRLCGFFRRANDTAILVKWLGEGDEPRVLSSADAWYLTEGDRDV
jgi:hypothetical protein